MKSKTNIKATETSLPTWNSLVRFAAILLFVALASACSQHHDSAGQAFVGKWVNLQDAEYTFVIKPDPNGPNYLVTSGQPNAMGAVNYGTFAGKMDGSVMTTSDLVTLSIDQKNGNLSAGSGAEYKKVR